MAAQPRIVALNLGMQTLSMAEFRTVPGGGLALNSYKHIELMVDPGADATRPAQIEAAVPELRNGLGIPAKEHVNFVLPSQSVFTRFVKLPGASPSEISSIIGFEAQQNVPFPIDEVVWDYQIMGGARDNAWDVALVAIKADQLGEINDAVNKSGLRTGVIDASPMALYNAFRYNYSEVNTCSLLIDIGARTTNLIFIEDQRLFSRSIPVGGNTISAAIAREFRQDITIAEKLKIEKGFVSLGGAYADPEDPTEAKVSKVVRNTMTRLHAEIARSISFYRQNQGGSQPVRAYLCGGTVGMTYMVEFFSEKLQMPIEFFNPLRNIAVTNQSTATSVADHAHTLGELVGAALRGLGNVPMEINLRPQSVVREQDLAKRKPALLAAALCLILAPLAGWFFFFQANSLAAGALQAVEAEVGKLDGIAKEFDAIEAKQKDLESIAGPLNLAAAERTAWSAVIDELGTRLPSRYIWITGLQPLVDGRPYNAAEGLPAARPGTPPAPSGPPRPGQQASAAPAIDALQITGLYLANPPNPDEQRVIDVFVDQLQKSDLFKIDEKEKARVVTQRTTPDGQSWAYGYTLVLPLTTPIPIQ